MSGMVYCPAVRRQLAGVIVIVAYSPSAVHDGPLRRSVTPGDLRSPHRIAVGRWYPPEPC